MMTCSRENSGKTSFLMVNAVKSPAAMITAISRLAATGLRANHAMIPLFSSLMTGLRSIRVLRRRRRLRPAAVFRPVATGSTAMPSTTNSRAVRQTSSPGSTPSAMMTCSASDLITETVRVRQAVVCVDHQEAIRAAEGLAGQYDDVINGSALDAGFDEETDGQGHPGGFMVNRVGILDLGHAVDHSAVEIDRAFGPDDGAFPTVFATAETGAQDDGEEPVAIRFSPETRWAGSGRPVGRAKQAGGFRPHRWRKWFRGACRW